MEIIVRDVALELLQPGLETLLPQARLLVVDKEGHTSADLSRAEVLYNWGLDRQARERIIDAAPGLRWLHTSSAGVDQLLTPALLERGITLTNSSGVHAIPIAEWVLAMLLASAKKLRPLMLAQQQQRWAKELHLDELAGRVLLILGLGDIGQAVARRAAAFDLRVWGSKRQPQPLPYVERVLGPHEWRAVLPEADYLLICLPLTSETRRLLGPDELAALKPGAWLFNIARGEIVDQEALIAALQQGQLGGAALDVFEQEPLPATSPLWSMNNVLISPHLSWSSPHIRRRAADLFLENLLRYERGQPLLNLVDLQAGY